MDFIVMFIVLTAAGLWGVAALFAMLDDLIRTTDWNSLGNIAGGIAILCFIWVPFMGGMVYMVWLTSTTAFTLIQEL